MSAPATPWRGRWSNSPRTTPRASWRGSGGRSPPPRAVPSASRRQHDRVPLAVAGSWQPAQSQRETERSMSPNQKFGMARRKRQRHGGVVDPRLVVDRGHRSQRTGRRPRDCRDSAPRGEHVGEHLGDLARPGLSYGRNGRGRPGGRSDEGPNCAIRAGGRGQARLGCAGTAHPTHRPVLRRRHDSAIISERITRAGSRSIEKTTSDTASRSRMVQEYPAADDRRTRPLRLGEHYALACGVCRYGRAEHVVRQVCHLRRYGIDQHLFEAADDDGVVAHNLLDLLVHRQALASSRSRSPHRRAVCPPAGSNTSSGCPVFRR